MAVSSKAKSRAQAVKQREKQIRDQLATLKAKGLYSGDLRKKPTRYGKSLTKKFEGVIAGRDRVVTIGSAKRKGHKTKGFAEAKQKFGKDFAVVRNKVVIPNVREGERVSINKKTGQVRKIEKDQFGNRYVRIVLSIKGKDVNALPKLKPGQSYAVPFRARGGGISYQYVTSKEDFLKLYFQYNTGNRNYSDMLNYVELAEYEDELDDENDE